jgi:hypothetical protein
MVGPTPEIELKINKMDRPEEIFSVPTIALVMGAANA